ncbi:MAG: radical SAM protein [Phycisphaerae bacterium]
MTASHPTAPPPLRIVFWESTTRCNLSCVHCRRLEDGSRSPDELTTDEVRSVIDSAAELGKPIFIFSGGEPLMRDDWEALAAHATQKALPTALATNGTMVDADMAGRIAAAGFRRVSVSFDGADPATHDAFRGVEGAFDAARTGALHLRAASVPTQVNATIAAHNDGQLDDLLALTRSLGAVALHLFLLVPVGCGVKIGPTHQLPPERYEAVLEWVLDRQAQTDIEVRATCAPHYYRLAARRGRDVTRSRGCLGGVAVAFVSHTGEVFPCGYLPVRCGSVREQTLADVWRESTVFADLRDPDRLTGKCGRCGYRTLCGGCRARAYAATGDYLSEEPACVYRPGG